MSVSSSGRATVFMRLYNQEIEMKYEMPALTDEQRKYLIEFSEQVLPGWTEEGEYASLIKIALAALTAEPVYFEIAGQLFPTRDDALRPGYRGTPEPLYEEPPVPALKLPDDVSESDAPESLGEYGATVWQWATNAAYAEVKRLNGFN